MTYFSTTKISFSNGHIYIEYELFLISCVMLNLHNYFCLILNTNAHLPQLSYYGFLDLLFIVRLTPLLSTLLLVQEVCGSIPGPISSDTVSPTAHHHCDVSSELCCLGFRPQRWTPPLVTRFGVIPRV